MRTIDFRKKTVLGLLRINPSKGYVTAIFTDKTVPQ